ncbi:unnamed protein product [Prorocentrum cordatum]|uniref:Phytanoyl-CoA dioxygenase family protein n=1 Tax=Prorocentrum cordatum TaxID=2364126 RepID=A0ABN9WW15_9DINO|nr:unnamed protein product [Polarella glacialis]
MFTVHPLTGENGAMRILPGQPSVDKVYRQQEHPPPKLDGEPWPSRRSQLFPLPAGCGILRDIRVWHGGVPNSTGEDRHLAVLQFYSRRVLRLCPLWKESVAGACQRVPCAPSCRRGPSRSSPPRSCCAKATRSRG